QVNAFSALTDAIGVTSPPETSVGSTPVLRQPMKLPILLLMNQPTAIRPMEKCRQLIQKLIHVFLH
ncbi:MAG: hypothetical protein NTZ76_07750, partial [Actinobacteria bacterium]|nr:hypothetical protein [Actinomycetota bacterium]